VINIDVEPGRHRDELTTEHTETETRPSGRVLTA
jgi:hypothetical protein